MLRGDESVNVTRHGRRPGILVAVPRAFLALTLGIAGLPTGAAELGPGQAEAFFESRVRPLLAAKCQSCHGEKIAEAGLRLDSRPRLLLGGDSGPVVVPGDVAKSRLIAAVKHVGDLTMPPDGRLAADEVAALEQWVSAGVPWSGPGGDDAAPVTSRAADMERRLAEARAAHWSLQPIRTHEPPAAPAGLGDTWAVSRIDRFIAARAAAAGLTPAAEAAPRELVRRLWLDLTGLPPPAAEVDAFEATPTDAAYRALVERLLAAPEHAEHWARRWLDLARYADTMGYAFDGQDSRYPYAWTYRDWVVRTLHDDMPYDRFVTLQLAADLVQPPVDRTDLAALGFLTVGRTFLGNRNDIIDDQIDLVTRGLMGLTVACARCHDHKYEAVTAADYYALHGIFASCAPPEELPQIGPQPEGPDAAAFNAKLAELEADIVTHEAKVHARASRDAVAHAADYFSETARPLPRKADGRPPRLDDGYELHQLLIDRTKRLLGGAKPDHPILGLWAQVRDASDAEIPALVARVLASWMPADGGEPVAVNVLVREELVSARPTTLRTVAEAYARLAMRAAPEMAGGPAATPEDPADLAALRALLGSEGAPLIVPAAEAMRVADREEQTQHRKLRQKITRHQAEAPGGPPRAMVVADFGKPGDSHVLLRGDPGRRGDLVPRRMPQVLGGTGVDAATSGRLDLARTIVAADNPLTARLIVNWVWTHHLGGPLVPTVDDLGLRGEPPTHPDLLDDLARRFIDEGAWSLRWLHREIVTSRTWRQSSGLRPELEAADPDNRLFLRATRRRLPWEAWRDSLLVAAGTLDTSRRGGPGVDPLAPGSMHVRSLYARLDRQNVPGILRVFDIANPDTAVHVRPLTTVPQQGLAALNAPLVVEAARRVAERVAREAGPDASAGAIVDGTWRAVLARSPAADERSAAIAWLAAEIEADRAAATAPDAAPAQGDAKPAGAAAQPVPFPAGARLAQALVATAEFEYLD